MKLLVCGGREFTDRDFVFATLDPWAPDGVVAFPGGAGTADMVARARAAGVTVWVPSYPPPAV